MRAFSHLEKDMSEKQRQSTLAGIAGDLMPNKNMQALGHLVCQFLKGVCDADTEIDTGIGPSEYDLWVKFGGKEHYIVIRHSNNQIAKDRKQS